jgi:transposase InsO family protein
LSRKRHVLQRRVCGRRFRILNIVGDVTRECLAAIPDTSISGKRVAREPTVLIQQRGKPGMIVSDHGTEPTSNAILAWCSEHRIEWHHIAPGKPMQNGYIESFNGRTRDELARASDEIWAPPERPSGTASVSGISSEALDPALQVLPRPAVPPPVMAGLVPAIHVFEPQRRQDVDPRDKPGDDDPGQGRG